MRATLLGLCLFIFVGTGFGSDYVLSHLSQTGRGRVIKTHDCFLIPQESGPTLTESPNTFNVYKGRNYSFKFSFSLYTSGDDPKTYSLETLLQKGWKVKAPPSDRNTYQVKTLHQNPRSITLLVQILAEPFFGDNFALELRDESGKIYGIAVFPFKVLHPDPDNNVTSTNKTLYPRIQLLYASRKGQGSPAVELELGAPASFDIDLVRPLKLNLQFEQEKFQNGKMYKYYVNPEQDYGYRVRYRWIGKAPPSARPKLVANNLQLTLQSSKPQPANTKRKIDRSRFGMDQRKVTGPRQYYKLEISLSRLPDLSESVKYYVTMGIRE